MFRLGGIHGSARIDEGNSQPARSGCGRSADAGAEVPAEAQARVEQLKEEMARVEQKLAAAPKPKTAAELKAYAEQRAADKMRRVEEIRELKKKHGAAWVFVPTAAELTAAAVEPIAVAEVPGMIRSMFEQLDIRPGRLHKDAAAATDDREIWEDLSEAEVERPQPPPLPLGQRPAPKEKPKKPAKEGQREDVWDDLFEMDEDER
jgi:hypothetical protein